MSRKYIISAPVETMYKFLFDVGRIKTVVQAIVELSDEELRRGIVNNLCYYRDGALDIKEIIENGYVADDSRR